MILKEEHYQKLGKYVPEMKKIVVNSSASCVSIGLKELMNAIIDSFKWERCKSCNNVLYNLVATVYNFYVQDTKEREAAKAAKDAFDFDVSTAAQTKKNKKK